MKKNILFVVPARLGDAIMLTPSLDYLKKLCPAFNIDILAFSPLAGEVFANNPYCNQQFLYANVSGNANFFKQYAFMVICHRDKSAINLLRDEPCPAIANDGVAWDKHQTEQNLDFINATIGELSHNEVSHFYAQIKDNARYVVYQPQIQNKPLLPVVMNETYIVLHLGCHGLNKSKSWWPWAKRTSHSKAWPISHYIKFANLLKTSHPLLKIVLTGGKVEQMLADDFLQQLPNSISLVGATNVQQLAIVVQNAKLFVSGDTGSMHVACSTNTPSITFLASSNSTRTGPYPSSRLRKVLQSDTMEDIDPEYVHENAVELLSTSLHKTS